MPYKDKRKTAEAMRRYRARKTQKAQDFEAQLRKIDANLAKRFRDMTFGKPRKRQRK